MVDNFEAFMNKPVQLKVGDYIKCYSKKECDKLLSQLKKNKIYGYYNEQFEIIIQEVKDEENVL